MGGPLPVLIGGLIIGGRGYHVFVTPLLRFVQICLRLLQTEVKSSLELRFPGRVQMCPGRVHMKPVCMHAGPFLEEIPQRRLADCTASLSVVRCAESISR